MPALQLWIGNPRPGRQAYLGRYASTGMVITPNPPRVGEMTTITYYLQNMEPRPITVRAIETCISAFGMGTAGEKLPKLGPLVLPADPAHIEEVHLEWVPLRGGHRCVRAFIYLEGRAQPLWLGCNLQVIEAAADIFFWRVPFRVGNPTAKPQPLSLTLSTSPVEGLQIAVDMPGARPAGGRHGPGRSQSYWLQPYEEREALLIVRAATPEAFESISDVQAWLGDQFLDGIRVIIRRPAQVRPSREPSMRRARLLERSMEADEEALVTLRSGRASW
jgi:hypothetical protein